MTSPRLRGRDFDGAQSEFCKATEVWLQLLSSSCTGMAFKDASDSMWRDIHRVIEDPLLLPARAITQPCDPLETPIPLIALHLLHLVDTILLGHSSGPGMSDGERRYEIMAMDQLERKCRLITNEKLETSISVFLFTRAPSMPKWISKAIAFTAEVAAHISTCKVQASLAGRALWLLISRVLLTPYALDARVMLAETPGIVEGFFKLVITGKVRLETAYPTTKGSSALSPCSRDILTLVHIFGPTTKWSGVTSTSESDALSQACREAVLTADGSSSDGVSQLSNATQTISAIFILTTSVEDYALRIALEPSTTGAITNLICRYAAATPAELAKWCLSWLVDRGERGFGISYDVPMTSRANAEEDGDNAESMYSPVVFMAGVSLYILHCIGRTKIGAEALQANGDKMLKAVRQLVKIHGEKELEACDLIRMTGGIVAACIIGNTTCASDAPVFNPRRLKHYSLLLMCSYCSKIAEGSRRLKVCGECHLARYCGRQCQQADWRSKHASVCCMTRLMPAARPAFDSVLAENNSSAC